VIAKDTKALAAKKAEVAKTTAAVKVVMAADTKAI